MSIEKITEKILSEAQGYADNAVAEARKQEEEIIAKAQADANKILLNVQNKIKAESEKVFSRRNSLAQLETRKMLLKAKQDAVNECFERAVAEVHNMDEEKYIEFLADTLSDIGVKCGEVLFNAKDAEAVGEKVVVLANEKGNDFKLSEKTINASGGFKVVAGKVEITATIESIIEDIKEEITPDVVKALFE